MICVCMYNNNTLYKYLVLYVSIYFNRKIIKLYMTIGMVK